MGYVFRDHEWMGPDTRVFEADAMHALLVLRADVIEGSTEDSPEERELAMIAETVGAYEVKRWPDGKVPGQGLSRLAHRGTFPRPPDQRSIEAKNKRSPEPPESATGFRVVVLSPLVLLCLFVIGSRRAKR